MSYSNSRWKKSSSFFLTALFLAAALFISCNSTADNTFDVFQGPTGSGNTDNTDGGTAKPALMSVWDVYSVSYTDNNGVLSSHQKPNVEGKLQFSEAFTVKVKVTKFNLDLDLKGQYEISSNTVTMTNSDGKQYISTWKVDGNNLEFSWGAGSEYTFFANH
ncbi:MAG: hypothetical protein A3F83_13575 [Candidatus Glassbacteria bacterium RIFCSPLOWO2_12_FULL_58_11]|uniref:Lipocalin-like domain-containing protein n=1 Tax=Candidatus Glassbacteria bacterium RIFCSPLOWO2_12_FULL_58_11 TaxID=1817867 RepID=A0A1F5YLW3_9BACT|nr:MAG: hypothetical protein A3F83_13575 [Candidatus Glassbacteria bacterium RIFCSPLOWO2_12_FULL_58_11]